MDTDETIENIRHSGAAVLQALEVMSVSLTQGQWSNHMATYRKLTKTVLLQNDWMKANAPDVPVPEYARIQLLAGELAELFDGYAQVMRSLHGGLPAGASAGVAATAVEPREPESSQEGNKLLAVLARLGASTRTSLASELGWPSSKVAAVAAPLIASGQLAEETGKRHRYRLTTNEH